MSEPLNASPLLAELRRLIYAQDTIALMPTPMPGMSVSSMGLDPMPAAAIVEMQHEISALVSQATDADLVAAYRETDSESGSSDAEALVTEIERRNLDI